MCDCDKTRLSADTTHLTYASVIIRNPMCPADGRICHKQKFFLRRKQK